MADPLIAVVGPTAAGKSELAFQLARAHQGEIVSCDSLQVYRGLDIGSAKPSPEERRALPHHLVDVAEPADDFSAAEYARQARAAVREIAGRGRLPLVVGGTGLYLRALLQGLFDGPARDEVLRRRLEALADRRGDERLHRLLRRVDPDSAARVPPRDRVRVIRALEVFALTGRPLSHHHQTAPEPLTGFRVLVLVLDPGVTALRARVEARTRRMFEAGLVEEVRGLLGRGLSAGLRPLQAIGYRQAVAVAQGHMSVEQAERETVTATLRYAKRQRTWFRHQLGGVWCTSAEEAIRAAQAFLPR
ncbi:MAG TPA: tRNA (adenosine(37)-N6)-dimethylallyltransferase MiaA [Vicinamibacteria bacterium]